MAGQGDPGTVAESDTVLKPCDPAGASVLLVDGESGTVTGWTGGAQRLLGYRASEAVGRTLAEFIAHPQADVPGSRTGTSPEAGHHTDAPGGSGSHAHAPGEPGSHADLSRDVRALESAPGVLALRHRDGRTVRLRARTVPLQDGTDDGRWMVFLGYAPHTQDSRYTQDSPNAQDSPGAEDSTGTEGAAGTECPGDPAEASFPLGPFGHVLLENSPVGLAIWDNDLRCRWANTMVDHSRGPFRNRRIGLPVRQAVHGFDPDMVEAVMRQVLRDGRPVVDHEFRWLTEDDSGDDHVTSSTLFRLDDANGRPIGICTFAIDITRSRSRERLALLSDIGLRIGTTLDVTTTAQELADAAVPLLADFATVDLAESVRLGGEPLEHLRPRSRNVPAFRRAAVASVNEGAPESAFEVGEVIYVPEGSPLLEVLSTGEPHYAPVMDTSSSTWFVHDPVRAQRVSSFAMHSMIVLPLEARRTILGVAVFIRAAGRPAFTPDDLELAREVVVRAALHLDNARRYTRERTAALALQRNLLPRSLRGGEAVELAGEYVPAEGDEAVGGDWFDAISLPGGRVGLVVGDVVGHGVEAAATMGRLRTAVHALALLDLPPAEVLTSFDRAAVALGEENRGIDGFTRPIVACTCAYAEYDPAAGTCTFAVAGHLPPFVIAPDGDVRHLDLPSGTPIGVGDGVYEEVTVPVVDGSLLVLFTDGLVGGLGNVDRGLAHLREQLARPSTDLGEYCREVIHSAAGVKPRDDAALLVARVRGGAGAGGG